MARKINLIVVHCSATKEGQVITRDDIDRMHKARGFAGIGYHWFIRLDGTAERGRPDEVPGAHVQGHNFDSIGICYAGGLDKDGRPKDTRTPAQKATLRQKVAAYKSVWPNARVCGHRDLSPDLNHDGKIEPREYLKSCPCFDVATAL